MSHERGDPSLVELLPECGHRALPHSDGARDVRVAMSVLVLDRRQIRHVRDRRVLSVATPIHTVARRAARAEEGAGRALDRLFGRRLRIGRRARRIWLRGLLMIGRAPLPALPDTSLLTAPHKHGREDEKHSEEGPHERRDRPTSRSGATRPYTRAVGKRSHAGWFLRIGLAVATFAIALVAFRSGVGVSDRDGVIGADLLTHTYYSLGLFVLGGLDLGVPRGGPAAMHGLLWIVYFLAPMITTSAVIESAVLILRPASMQRRTLRDHIVVVGLGPLGMTFLEALRERDPKVRILVVERDSSHASVVGERFGALHLSGDVRAQATIGALRLERARALVLLTGDDLVNLEVAWHAVSIAPQLAIVAHVGDIGMRRLVARSASSDVAERVTIFNSHHIAARGLHQEHLASLFEKTGPADVVVVAGFGRFGQTILEHLRSEAAGEVQRAIVVDLDAARKLRLFEAQVDVTEGCEIVCIDGNLDDPETWTAVEEATRGVDVEPVYVLCTDDDGLNLRMAIMLRGERKSAPIFVRCVYRSAFTAELSEELSFSVLEVQGMLRRTMSERMSEWTDARSS